MYDPAKTPYYNAVCNYNKGNPLRFHVPGHKGGSGASSYLIDFLEKDVLPLDIPRRIRGVDIGPDSPLEQAQQLAAQAWKAGQTFFLVNGASQGVLAAVLTVAHRTQKKGKLEDIVIVQSNAHISLHNGLVLSGLRPVFVDPELDKGMGIAHCLTTESLEQALKKNPGARAIFVTSPTYYGACADICAFVEIAHNRGIPLIVDESWGSHFVFHEDYPGDAISAGADLVISSTHKTSGSLTQSAMLHLSKTPHGELTKEKVKSALKLIESTSPSSLLISSLDLARAYAVTHGHQALTQRLVEIKNFREKILEITNLNVFDQSLCSHASVKEFDPLSIIIDLRKTGIDGWSLDKALYAHANVELELVSERLLVLLIGMHESIEKSGEIFCENLRDVLEKFGTRTPMNHFAFNPVPKRCELVITPREATMAPSDTLPLDKAEGRIAAEPLMAYPPGIPVLLPGERISAATVSWYHKTIENGGHVEGGSGTPGNLQVVALAHDLLRSVPLFSILDGDLVESLVLKMKEHTFSAGEAIIKQGEPGDYFYIIASGQVEIVSNGNIIDQHGPGGYFGEIALWNNSPRTATVRAIKKTDLFSLQRRYFLSAVSSHPSASKLIETLITARLRNL